VNAKLLEELGGRINNWSPEQKIGDVFLTFVPFLKTYTSYSSNYSSGTGDQDITNSTVCTVSARDCPMRPAPLTSLSTRYQPSRRICAA
jgi:hypothetical protein